MILDKPPRTWKRPALPHRVQVQVLQRAIRTLLACDTIEYDHRPPLYLRKFDTETNDTIPPANDPNYMEAIAGDMHRVRTHGTAATSYGSDAHERAKMKRLERTGRLTPEEWHERGELIRREGNKAAWKFLLSPKLPGGKDSPLKKKLNGRVVKR